MKGPKGSLTVKQPKPPFAAEQNGTTGEKKPQQSSYSSMWPSKGAKIEQRIEAAEEIPSGYPGRTGRTDRTGFRSILESLTVRFPRVHKESKERRTGSKGQARPGSHSAHSSKGVTLWRVCCESPKAPQSQRKHTPPPPSDPEHMVSDPQARLTRLPPAQCAVRRRLDWQKWSRGYSCVSLILKIHLMRSPYVYGPVHKRQSSYASLTKAKQSKMLPEDATLSIWWCFSISLLSLKISFFRFLEFSRMTFSVKLYFAEKSQWMT